jgi:para-nitrobenzyl esterase
VQRAIILILPALLLASCGERLASTQVRTPEGALEGALNADKSVLAFKGIPYAAPPVGALRWKAPQPVAPWSGVRQAAAFGAHCMQTNVFGDMVFRDPGQSEDCLSLNVWAPTAPHAGGLPVMVWIYGGGFVAGATSEARQDGEKLATRGVVVVSMNYRLGVFGFFAHPDLDKESGHNASGNYGLMDQLAALQWVHRNIALFGGDPENVTIFGESAGSFSVSAMMATPLAHGLLKHAIGESGAFFADTLPAKPRNEAEKQDLKFAQASLGTSSLEALRAKSADDLLKAASAKDVPWFSPIIDGYFLPEAVPAIYAAGRQSHVALLAGWNADEGSYKELFDKEAPTARNYAAIAKKRFGNQAATFLKLYAGGTDAQAKRSAQDFGGDMFIAFGTWRWIEAQKATGGSPVFRYEFDDAPPAAPGSTEDNGAYHSAEIEFVFGALPSKALPWRPEDYRLSTLMSAYWSNFAKTGDPNSTDLPKWPAYDASTGYQVMHLSANSHSEPDTHRARYEWLVSMGDKLGAPH